MKTTQTLKAAVLVALGLGCAVAVFTVNSANTANAGTTVAVSATTTASGESMPVVTITAKRLTPTQKIVQAMRDKVNGEQG
ncbi:MAG TPA: hypothetical protein VEC06_19670 [Paucimonas sp.]|nr:hypothetical protein [Paucimonas sp.]